MTDDEKRTAGWPDVFIAQHFHAGNLWLNNHNGTFTKADGGFSPSDRHDCLAADFNADGRQDLFCSVGADRGTALKSYELYIQQPDHTFAQEASQWYVSDPAGRGRNGAVLDANNDGRPDIFVGTAALRADGLPSPNRLYLNTGHGSMLDSPAMGLDLNIGSKCAHAADYNSDGRPDLLVCGDGDRVYPLDFNHDGLTDFLVLNGGGDASNIPGPIQLLTPTPLPVATIAGALPGDKVRSWPSRSAPSRLCRAGSRRSGA